MKRLLLIIICLCLLLTGCASSEEEAEGHVTIWYIKGEALERQLIDECRRIGEESPGLELELLAFDSMSLLSAELQGRRPDLLLCSHEMAWTLQEQGMLKKLSLDGLAYTSSLVSSYTGIGTEFFPIGAAVELLCSKTECMESGFEGFLTGLSDNNQLMTADSFSRMMSTALMQLGGELSTDRLENAANDKYAYLHNLIAETALAGAVAAFDEGGAELLKEGRVEYALVSSTLLTELGEGWNVSPMPTVEGGKMRCMADMRGFAYLGNTFDNSKATALVLKHLLSAGRGVKLSLKAGLVPAQVWDGENTDTDLERALFEIYTGWELVLPSPISGFVQGRQELESELRAAVGYLQ